ncbi:hypothetical protein F7725_011634 [Dissostichus mawsoni]|uniref:Integrin alpha 6 n=1 Tax=Dissostichus mawsoni TaxID=36200 RepID=A0A7J5ZA67_DISMA|nr:hypothetical protein F7725_011634 [Dissostichus mawsoni]
MYLMEVRITCGLWFFAFILGCGRLSAFNLDSTNVQRKNGDPGSYFGFSLAMHWQLAPQDKRMLLVGAPRAKAMSGQKSNKTNEESKENQWMGVTVNSQGPGGKVVTCAHRYQRRSLGTSESRDIIGRCYVLGQSLKINPNTDEEGDTWHFCQGRTTGHERFGSCQQGLSATFDKDYHYLIFGAPGAYGWKGVVRLEQKNETFLDQGIYDDGPFETGDERNRNPNLVPAPSNSYLGFSLDSGKSLIKKGELTVVAGAPRANHSGAVVLMKKEGYNSMSEQYTLEGEGLASSFGYDLTVLDLNNDGWQDIVVGAPQYFEKDGVIGGAVYVYVNKLGKWNTVMPIRIDGPSDSMFGLAVENLGDINQDGYHDFAVGAPNQGAGQVYIYHGILSGEALGVKMFGYSLAGNMDLDKNAYPDLAVGSLSDSVFVYRARPVINIQKEVKFTPEKINLTKKNCGENFCLDIEACFTFTAEPKSYAPRLTVAYSLEADAEHRKKRLNPRAVFKDGSENSYESKGTITMDTKGKKQCIIRKLIIKDNIKDKLHGIPIDVSVDIQDGNRKRRQSSTGQLAPVLGAKEPPTIRSEVSFLKEGCGTDNICQSNLQVKYRYGNRTTDKNGNDEFAPLKLEGGVPVFSLSDQKEITLEVTVTNLNGDDAHEASGAQVSCIANKDGSEADCDLGNPFKRDAQTTFFILLGTSDITSNTTDLEIVLQLNTTSNQDKLASVKAKAKVAIMLQLSISGLAQPSQVYFSGKSKGETAIKSESEMGTAITHRFSIINLGKSLKDFGTATLDIDWPKETMDGKWLLYLMKISATGVGQIDCTPKEEINPLSKEASKTRKRRETENTLGNKEGTISRLLDGKNSKTLGLYVRISCPLRGMDSNAVFTLNSRLWNSTFIEKYSKLHHVEVIVMASLNVDSRAKNTVLKNSEFQLKLTVFPERREAQYGGVPWWIIVLSILFGLLLLALLAFLLWKCGFFKRAKYEDKVPSYNAVRIRREERTPNPVMVDWENVEKKPWMTTWRDKEHFS